MLERAWQPKACWMTRSKDSGHPPHATMGAVAWRICLPLLRSLQQTMMLPLFASEWIYVLFFFFLSSVFFLCSSIKIVLMKREGQLLTVLFKKRKFFPKLIPKLIANRFFSVQAWDALSNKEVVDIIASHRLVGLQQELLSIAQCGVGVLNFPDVKN